jgi:cysteine synthase
MLDAIVTGALRARRLIDSTSGNTGVAYAFGAAPGYRSSS